MVGQQFGEVRVSNLKTRPYEGTFSLLHPHVKEKDALRVTWGGVGGSTALRPNAELGKAAPTYTGCTFGSAPPALSAALSNKKTAPQEAA